MRYVDTSLLVAALSREAATAQAQAWLDTPDTSQLAVSDWTLTEMSSAMAIKVRTGQIDLGHRAAAMAIFQKMVAESFVVLAVTGEHFRTAARFVEQHALGLRAGDALHLAAAAQHGATVHTLDKRLADAAPILGVSAQLLA